MLNIKSYFLSHFSYHIFGLYSIAEIIRKLCEIGELIVALFVTLPLYPLQLESTYYVVIS